MSDEHLARAMQATARDLHPDVTRLLEGGVQRGRRKRRVKRISQVVGSAASVTVLCGAAVLVSSQHSGSPARPTAVTPASSPSASATSTTSAPPVSGAYMIETLKSLLPTDFTLAGSKGIGTFEPNTEGYGALARTGLMTGANVGYVEVRIGQTSWTVHPEGKPARQLTDGSTLYFVDVPDMNGPLQRVAKLLRPDGSYIEVHTYTAKGPEKGHFLLTDDQLSTVIESPAWDPAARAELTVVPPKHPPTPPWPTTQPAGGAVDVPTP